MANVNICMISGTIMEPPYSANGICKLKLVSLHKNKKSDKEDKAMVDIVTFGELAVMCADLKEGARIYAEGRLKHCSKEMSDGKKQYWTELHAKDVQKI